MARDVIGQLSRKDTNLATVVMVCMPHGVKVDLLAAVVGGGAKGLLRFHHVIILACLSAA